MRQLWCAVLVQLLDDAAGITRAAHQRGEAAKVTAQARRWIRQGDDQFRTVCWLAGLDPDIVRPYALARIEAAL